MIYIIKRITNKFSFDKNYKLYRKIQKITNYSFKKEFADYNVKLKNRTINIRCFNVNNKTKKDKVIIYFHGGGWISGSIESYTNILYKISQEINKIIVAVDYRLAPEYKFPCGFDDCYDVTKLIAEQIGSKRIILMGDSAGGNLVAAVSQKLKDNFEFRIRKQILIYPSLSADYKINSKYKSVIESQYILNRKHLEDMINNYIDSEKDFDNPYVAPIKSNRLFLSPHTFIITCEYDPLKDEGYEYYKKLKRYFNKCKYLHFEKIYHGFLTNPLEKKYTNLLIKEIKKFIENK